jgi:hypothetical protein
VKTPLKRTDISFVSPEAPVTEPQFKVLDGDQQMGVAVERPTGWAFYWIGSLAAPAATALTLWDLVDAIIEVDVQTRWAGEDT